MSAAVDPVESGEPAMVETPVAAQGQYTLRVSSADTNSGVYALDVDLNFVREVESLGGLANNTIGTAQPLTFQTIPGTPADRAAVQGSAESVSASDHYAVSLSAGLRLLRGS